MDDVEIRKKKSTEEYAVDGEEGAADNKKQYLAKKSQMSV